MSDNPSLGVLDGLKIIEMAGIGPAPLAGQLLGDHGASVIVIDRKSGQNHDGDPNRRGKRSIALDLKQAAGIEIFNKLVSQSDILIEGFRPGVMERLGLGPDECLKTNPKLIYGRMTGWGQDGTLSQTAGHDLNYLAITGALHAMGAKNDMPRPPLNLVADYGGGTMFLLFGILSALYARNNTGKGQVVDAAMVDGVIAMLGLVHGQLGQGLWTNQREANWLDGAAPFYRCYRCKDGGFLSVAPIEPQFFAEFVRLAKLPEKFLKQQMDKSFWPQMNEEIEALMLTKTRDEWAEIFLGSDACVAPVLDWEEAEKHPHNVARENLVERGGVVQSGIAPRINGAPTEFGSTVSSGANSDEILGECGIGLEKIAQLRQFGVVS